MAIDDVAAVRNAYRVAERKDLEGWVALFTPDGEFTDNCVGATYRGRDLAEPVRNYGTAFSNMHRELGRIYTDGNVVVVQLALPGTHDGPLQLPFGELTATGKQMDAPHAVTCSSCKTARSTIRLLPRRVRHIRSARGLDQSRSGTHPLTRVSWRLRGARVAMMS